MLSGKTQVIAVSGGVVEMPSKKPLTKLKAKLIGVKIITKIPARLEKIYSIE
jgi:hypothetical protein